MAGDFRHYRTHGDDPVEWRWESFDPAMPDEDLKELMAPLQPEAIERREEIAIVHFRSPYHDALLVREMLRRWGAEHKAEAERRRELEAARSRRRFEEYYESLGLDEYIEVPSVATTKEGKEVVMHKVRIEGGG